MFAKAIDQVQFDDIEQFCRTGVREGILLDFKSDFPARLDKTIAAFANTYGGHILIGVGEQSTGSAQLPIDGVPLVPGLRERVVSTALQAIFPPVYPEVRVVEFPSVSAPLGTNDRAIVLVRVAESDTAAHAVNGATDVYLRVDNITDPYKRATVEEIEWFSEKRKKCRDLKAQILVNVKTHVGEYLLRLRAHNRWPTTRPKCRLVSWASPMYPRVELTTPERLLHIAPSLRMDVGRATKFPFSAHPVPVQGGIRFPDTFTPNLAYAEVNSFGLVYSDVGVGNPEEAGSDRINCEMSASVLVATLRYSLRLYEALGYFGLVDFGLSLSPATNLYPSVPDAFGGDEHLQDYRSMEKEISIRIVGSVKDLSKTWLERSKDAFREFLWAFGWDAARDNIAARFAHWQIAP